MAGPEEDVVDQLVDEFRTRFKRGGGMCRRQRDRVGRTVAGHPGVGQYVTKWPENALSGAAFRSPMTKDGHGPSVPGAVARSASCLA